MPYRYHCIDELVFVRWTAGEAEDLDVILNRISARHAELDRPLVYVSIQDRNTKTPDEAFARRVIALARDLVDQTAWLFMVVEIPGISGGLHKRALKSVLAAARAVEPQRAAKVAVVDSVAEALARAEIAPERLVTIRAELEREGMWPEQER